MNKNSFLLDQRFLPMVIEVNFLMHVQSLYLIDHYGSLSVMIQLEKVYQTFLMLHNDQLFHNLYLSELKKDFIQIIKKNNFLFFLNFYFDHFDYQV